MRGEHGGQAKLECRRKFKDIQEDIFNCSEIELVICLVYSIYIDVKRGKPGRYEAGYRLEKMSLCTYLLIYVLEQFRESIDRSLLLKMMQVVIANVAS